MGEGVPESSFVGTFAVGLPMGVFLDRFGNVLEHGGHVGVSVGFGGCVRYCALSLVFTSFARWEAASLPTWGTDFNSDTASLWFVLLSISPRWRSRSNPMPLLQLERHRSPPESGRVRWPTGGRGHATRGLALICILRIPDRKFGSGPSLSGTVGSMPVLVGKHKDVGH